MALSVSFSVLNDEVVGTKRHRHVTIVPDDSYPLGGEVLSAASCGFSYIERVIFHGPFVDPDTVDNAVVPHAARVSGAINVLLFWSNSDAADGPLVEVPDTTDLSAFSGTAVVVGW